MSVESDHSRKQTKKIGKNNVIYSASFCSHFIHFLLKNLRMLIYAPACLGVCDALDDSFCAKRLPPDLKVRDWVRVFKPSAHA